MRVIVKMKIGITEYVFNVDEREDMDALHKAIVLGNPRMKCDICGNYERGKFKLSSNKDREGHIYVDFICKKCGATSKLGQYKTGGYFWKNFVEIKYGDKDTKKGSKKRNKKDANDGDDDFFDNL